MATPRTITPAARPGRATLSNTAISISSLQTAAASRAIAGSLGGTRVAQVVASNLVFTDGGASTIGIYACLGLPSNTAPASLVVAETSKPLDFAFSPDLNTLYISDNGTFGGTSAIAGGVQRWDASGAGPDGFPNYTYGYTLQNGDRFNRGRSGIECGF